VRPAVLAFAAAFAVSGLLISDGAAQDRARDRRRFLTPETRTTDDPRRVPIDPTQPRGTDGSIGVRGGRVFDGTGAPVRPATCQA